MRRLVCKYVSKAVEEETGIRMDISIDDLYIDTKGRDYTVHMAETISVNKKDLKQFIKDNVKRKAPSK